jgi:hypothetical protein
MTPQEIFDTTARALLKQGKPSVRVEDNGSFCAYLTDDGSRCAVGWLFNDDELAEFGEFEGGLCSILETHPNELRPLFTEHEDLLSAIQDAHDFPATTFNAETERVEQVDPAEWRMNFIENMRDLASKYNLDAAVLKEAA